MTKLIQICQKNSSKINTIIRNQERLETALNDQKNQISEIMSILDAQRDTEAETKGTKGGKSKGEEKDEFYSVNIYDFIIYNSFISF